MQFSLRKVFYCPKSYKKGEKDSSQEVAKKRAQNDPRPQLPILVIVLQPKGFKYLYNTSASSIFQTFVLMCDYLAKLCYNKYGQSPQTKGIISFKKRKQQ